MKNEGEIKAPTQSSSTINLSPLENKMDLLIAAIEKGSIIQMDGTKLGETVNQGARAIQ